MPDITGEHFDQDQVVLSGGDTVRNSAFTHPGSETAGKNEIHLMTANAPDSGEEILLEHCYFSGGRAVNGFWIGNGTGTLRVKECTFEQVNDALYTDELVSGDVIVENCLFRNCNISQLRMGAGEARNVTIYNTNDVPPNGGDQVNSRGIHNFYESPNTVTITNAHVDVTDENTNGGASAVDVNGHSADFIIRDSQILGSVGEGGKVTLESVGEQPSHNAPSGCPLGVEEAVNGMSSAAGLPGETGVAPVSEVVVDGENTLTVGPE